MGETNVSYLFRDITESDYKLKWIPQTKEQGSEQSIDVSAHMEGTPQSYEFPVEKEYTRCITALSRTGILMSLPKSESIGVIGIDGREYPVPIQKQEKHLKILLQNFLPTSRQPVK